LVSAIDDRPHFGAVLAQRAQNKSHLRRIAVLLLSCCLGNPLALALVGLFNRPTGRIRTVFLLYPASKGYAQTYVYNWFAGRIRFNPALVGIYRQNGCFGLVFGISATERDFLSPANDRALRHLHARMERLRRLTGARQTAFAGILPGLLASRGMVSASPEQDPTVSAVRMAVTALARKTGMAPDTPIIVLGARGFVGRKLLAAMAGYEGELVPIDLRNRQEFAATAARLHGSATILLNVSTRGALREYAPLLWPEAVVLNEVYPEPGREELRLLAEAGVQCWHIAGVRGAAWPPFPRAYRAGIPCCASWLPEGEGEYEVIIERKGCKKRREEIDEAIDEC
jgi:hypothetical protein